MTHPPARRDRLAGAVASAATLAGAATIAASPWVGLAWSRWIPFCVLVVSAGLVHVKHLGAQLAARSAWLATAALALAFAVPPTVLPLAPQLALAMTMFTALVALGGKNLGEGVAGAFRPMRYRAPLSLSLVAGGAMSLVLGWFEMLMWEATRIPPNATASLFVVLAASLVGLYRMRVWGLLGSTITAAAVFSLALMRDMPAWSFMAVASAATLAGVAPAWLLVARALRQPQVATARARHRIAHSLAAQTAADSHYDLDPRSEEEPLSLKESGRLRVRSD